MKIKVNYKPLGLLFLEELQDPYFEASTYDHFIHDLGAILQHVKGGGKSEGWVRGSGEGKDQAYKLS